MKIASTLSPEYRGESFYRLFETSVGERSFLVALGEGQVVGSDVHLLPADGDTLERLAALTQRDSGPGAMVQFAELHHPRGVAERMARIFAAVEDGSSVMFLCRDADTCEAAFDALQVSLVSDPKTWH